MKNTTKSIVGLAALIVLPATAGQVEFSAADDRTETKICVAAAANNLYQYKQKVESLSHRKNIHSIVANKLSCNGQPILKFAAAYNADDTAEFISKYSNYKITIEREVAKLDSTHNAPTKVVVSAD